MTEGKTRPKVAVHKFSSCDGCQLAFLNMGEALIELSEKVELVHFAEAGWLNESAQVDVAFIEGSVYTQKDEQRIQRIRENSQLLITMGACATSGGIQALKNSVSNPDIWTESIYAQPAYIDTLRASSSVSRYVKVDFEIWGCPITSQQIISVVDTLLRGVLPRDKPEKLCMACKRDQIVCTLVTRGEPCLGPVTRTGCGALCPSFGRACYGCFGPSAVRNEHAMVNRIQGLGLNKRHATSLLNLVHSERTDKQVAVEVDPKQG